MQLLGTSNGDKQQLFYYWKAQRWTLVHQCGGLRKWRGNASITFAHGACTAFLTRARPHSWCMHWQGSCMHIFSATSLPGRSRQNDLWANTTSRGRSILVEKITAGKRMRHGQKYADSVDCCSHNWLSCDYGRSAKIQDAGLTASCRFSPVCRRTDSF